VNQSHAAFIPNIEAILKNLSEVKNLKYYFTDATHNFYRGADVQVASHTFSQVIPAFVGAEVCKIQQWHNH
jgi:hypothetical protein